MRLTAAMLILLTGLWHPLPATADAPCPRAVGYDVLGAPLPESDSWYGGEGLAVELPADGTWPTTSPGALIAVKLFWWSAGFRPGLESNLSVSVTNLNGGPMTAVVSRPTNAHAESLGGWVMLTGIDFPDPGCWEITGRYLGQSLTFVVETISVNEWKSLHSRGAQ